MLAGMHKRVPLLLTTQTESELQSPSLQQAVAQRSSFRFMFKSKSPGCTQKPPAHSESALQPLPTGRGSMHTPVLESQI
jgi:hypothetical protein